LLANRGWGCREAILERLVALDRERAAEEAQGKVRWLRPEFQNPAVTAQPTQTKISLVPIAAAVPGKASPWPEKLPDQVRSVQAALHALGQVRRVSGDKYAA